MNLRVCVGIAVVALIAMAFVPRGGVREIREADQITNFALVEPRPHVDDWPWWRGPLGRNVTTSDEFPKLWPISHSDGWQVAVPGRGNATPILWGDQLFLLTSEIEAQRISLRSYHRSTGREMWWTTLHQDAVQTIHEKSSHASSTPACDGQFVYTVAATQGGLWLTSTDLSGKIVWQREAGPYRSRSGYSSSPALFQSLIIVVADQKEGSYLAALHRQTGEIVWRIRRPNGESFSSPLVATLAGRPQVIVGGRNSIASYNPATGDSLWTFRCSAERMVNSVAFDNDHVFATYRHPQPEVLCIKADGSGDVTQSRLIWSQTKFGSEFPSPVYHQGLLYVLADDGMLRCLEAATGKVEWRKRLEGNFSASPLIAGDCLVCGNEAGVTYIVQTGVSGEILAENSLSDGIMASPIVAGNSIFIRTRNSLHRISAPTVEPVVEKPDRLKRRL